VPYDGTKYRKAEVATIVKVCDMLPGGGKTSASISLINSAGSNERFVFITPYKTEIARIVEKCGSRNFKAPPDLRYPIDYIMGESKLDHLHKLLSNRENVVSSHSLFIRSTEETRRLIQEGGYTLILDEVVDVFQPCEFSTGDMFMLLDKGVLKRDSMGVLVWDYEYEGETFRSIIERSEVCNLITSNDQDFFWMFPMDIFKCFKNCYVLTYMFEYQPLRPCFESAGIKYELIGCRKTAEEQYEFCLAQEVDRRRDLRGLVKVVDKEKRNDLGKYRTDLSMRWYKKDTKSGAEGVSALKRHVCNSLRSDMDGSGDIMWTTFADYKTAVKGKGYSKNYLSFNQRATNEYRECTKIAYTVNVFMNPHILHHLNKIGSKPFHQDTWATSTLVQFLFRSAIRDGRPINLFIPSARMRKLLKTWMENLASGRDLEPVEVSVPSKPRGKRGTKKED